MKHNGTCSQKLLLKLKVNFVFDQQKYNISMVKEADHLVAGVQE